jgi:hypothetical protein
MDIRVMMKNMCTRVSDSARLVLKKITVKRLHIRRLSPGWTNYQVGGLVAAIVCLGLLACFLKHRYCMAKNLGTQEQSSLGQSSGEQEESRYDTVALSALESKVTATVEMLHILEQKIDAIAEKQSAEKSAEVASKIKQEVSRQVDQINKKKKVLSKLMAEVSDNK